MLLNFKHYKLQKILERTKIKSCNVYKQKVKLFINKNEENERSFFYFNQKVSAI